MTDANERRPDPQPDEAQIADETQTQWVAADRPPAEPPTTAEDPGGWFPPAAADEFPPPPADEPRWANWDQPWDPTTDEPFDQSAPGQQPAAAYPAVSGPPREQPADRQQPSDPASAQRASWANLHALRVLAQIACPILLIVGLTFGEGDAPNGWDAYTAWAIFATICSIIQLAPLVGRSLGVTAENAWFLGAVGTAGLVGFWVIIVLPGVSSNAGFAQTLAAAFAVIGLWLSPGRRV